MNVIKKHYIPAIEHVKSPSKAPNNDVGCFYNTKIIINSISEIF